MWLLLLLLPYSFSSLFLYFFPLHFFSLDCIFVIVSFRRKVAKVWYLFLFPLFFFYLYIFAFLFVVFYLSLFILFSEKIKRLKNVLLKKFEKE